MTKKNSMLNEIKDYINSEVNIFKIGLLEKLAKLLSFTVSIMIAVFTLIIAVAYFSFMIYNIFLTLFNNSVTLAVVVTIVLFLIFTALLIILSRKIFVNFFISQIHQILFPTKSTKTSDKIADETQSSAQNYNKHQDQSSSVNRKKKVTI